MFRFDDEEDFLKDGENQQDTKKPFVFDFVTPDKKKKKEQEQTTAEPFVFDFVQPAQETKPQVTRTIRVKRPPKLPTTMNLADPKLSEEVKRFSPLNMDDLSEEDRARMGLNRDTPVPYGLLTNPAPVKSREKGVEDILDSSKFIDSRDEKGRSKRIAQGFYDITDLVDVNQVGIPVNKKNVDSSAIFDRLNTKLYEDLTNGDKEASRVLAEAERRLIDRVARESRESAYQSRKAVESIRQSIKAESEKVGAYLILDSNIRTPIAKQRMARPVSVTGGGALTPEQKQAYGISEENTVNKLASAEKVKRISDIFKNSGISGVTESIIRAAFPVDTEADIRITPDSVQKVLSIRDAKKLNAAKTIKPAEKPPSILGVSDLAYNKLLIKTQDGKYIAPVMSDNAQKFVLAYKWLQNQGVSNPTADQVIDQARKLKDSTESILGQKADSAAAYAKRLDDVKAGTTEMPWYEPITRGLSSVIRSSSELLGYDASNRSSSTTDDFDLINLAKSLGIDVKSTTTQVGREAYTENKLVASPETRTLLRTILNSERERIVDQENEADFRMMVDPKLGGGAIGKMLSYMHYVLPGGAALDKSVEKVTGTSLQQTVEDAIVQNGGTDYFLANSVAEAAPSFVPYFGMVWTLHRADVNTRELPDDTRKAVFGVTVASLGLSKLGVNLLTKGGTAGVANLGGVSMKYGGLPVAKALGATALVAGGPVGGTVNTYLNWQSFIDPDTKKIRWAQVGFNVIQDAAMFIGSDVRTILGKRPIHMAPWFIKDVETGSHWALIDDPQSGGPKITRVSEESVNKYRAKAEKENGPFYIQDVSTADVMKLKTLENSFTKNIIRTLVGSEDPETLLSKMVPAKLRPAGIEEQVMMSDPSIIRFDGKNIRTFNAGEYEALPKVKMNQQEYDFRKNALASALDDGELNIYTMSGDQKFGETIKRMQSAGEIKVQDNGKIVLTESGKSRYDEYVKARESASESLIKEIDTLRSNLEGVSIEDVIANQGKPATEGKPSTPLNASVFAAKLPIDELGLYTAAKSMSSPQVYMDMDLFMAQSKSIQNSVKHAVAAGALEFENGIIKSPNFTLDHDGVTLDFGNTGRGYLEAALFEIGRDIKSGKGVDKKVKSFMDALGAGDRISADEVRKSALAKFERHSDDVLIAKAKSEQLGLAEPVHVASIVDDNGLMKSAEEPEAPMIPVQEMASEADKQVLGATAPVTPKPTAAAAVKAAKKQTRPIISGETVKNLKRRNFAWDEGVTKYTEVPDFVATYDGEMFKAYEKVGEDTWVDASGKEHKPQDILAQMNQDGVKVGTIAKDQIASVPTTKQQAATNVTLDIAERFGGPTVTDHLSKAIVTEDQFNENHDTFTNSGVGKLHVGNDVVLEDIGVPGTVWHPESDAHAQADSDSGRVYLNRKATDLVGWLAERNMLASQNKKTRDKATRTRNDISESNGFLYPKSILTNLGLSNVVMLNEDGTVNTKSMSYQDVRSDALDAGIVATEAEFDNTVAQIAASDNVSGTVVIPIDHNAMAARASQNKAGTVSAARKLDTTIRHETIHQILASPEYTGVRDTLISMVKRDESGVFNELNNIFGVKAAEVYRNMDPEQFFNEVLAHGSDIESLKSGLGLESDQELTTFATAYVKLMEGIRSQAEETGTNAYDLVKSFSDSRISDVAEELINAKNQLERSIGGPEANRGIDDQSGRPSFSLEVEKAVGYRLKADSYGAVSDWEGSGPKRLTDGRAVSGFTVSELPAGFEAATTFAIRRPDGTFPSVVSTHELSKPTKSVSGTKHLLDVENDPRAKEAAANMNFDDFQQWARERGYDGAFGLDVGLGADNKYVGVLFNKKGSAVTEEYLKTYNQVPYEPVGNSSKQALEIGEIVKDIELRNRPFFSTDLEQNVVLPQDYINQNVKSITSGKGEYHLSRSEKVNFDTDDRWFVTSDPAYVIDRFDPLSFHVNENMSRMMLEIMEKRFAPDHADTYGFSSSSIDGIAGLLLYNMRDLVAENPSLTKKWIAHYGTLMEFLVKATGKTVPELMQFVQQPPDFQYAYAKTNQRAFNLSKHYIGMNLSMSVFTTLHESTHRIISNMFGEHVAMALMDINAMRNPITTRAFDVVQNAMSKSFNSLYAGQADSPTKVFHEALAHGTEARSLDQIGINPKNPAMLKTYAQFYGDAVKFIADNLGTVSAESVAAFTSPEVGREIEKIYGNKLPIIGKARRDSETSPIRPLLSVDRETADGQRSIVESFNRATELVRKARGAESYGRTLTGNLGTSVTELPFSQARENVRQRTVLVNGQDFSTLQLPSAVRDVFNQLSTKPEPISAASVKTVISNKFRGLLQAVQNNVNALNSKLGAGPDTVLEVENKRISYNRPYIGQVVENLETGKITIETAKDSDVAALNGKEFKTVQEGLDFLTKAAISTSNEDIARYKEALTWAKSDFSVSEVFTESQLPATLLGSRLSKTPSGVADKVTELAFNGDRASLSPDYTLVNGVAIGKVGTVESAKSRDLPNIPLEIEQLLKGQMVYATREQMGSAEYNQRISSRLQKILDVAKEDLATLTGPDGKWKDHSKAIVSTPKWGPEKGVTRITAESRHPEMGPDFGYNKLNNTTWPDEVQAKEALKQAQIEELNYQVEKYTSLTKWIKDNPLEITHFYGTDRFKGTQFNRPRTFEEATGQVQEGLTPKGYDFDLEERLANMKRVPPMFSADIAKALNLTDKKASEFVEMVDELRYAGLSTRHEYFDEIPKAQQQWLDDLLTDQVILAQNLAKMNLEKVTSVDIDMAANHVGDLISYYLQNDFINNQELKLLKVLENFLQGAKQNVDVIMGAKARMYPESKNITPVSPMFSADRAGEGELANLTNEDGFYSNVDMAMRGFNPVHGTPLNKKFPVKASGKEWLNILKSIPGIKETELKWSGLDSLLTENQNSSVTRDDIQEFIKTNKVHAVTLIEQGYDTKWSEYQGGDYILDGPTKRNIEMLVTVPALVPGKTSGKTWTEADLPPHARLAHGTNINNETVWYIEERHWQPNDSGRYSTNYDYSTKSPLASTPEKAIDGYMNRFATGYQEPHWPEANNVAISIRANERDTSDGRRAMHIEELQSTLSQVDRDQIITPETDYNRQLGAIRMEATKLYEDNEANLKKYNLSFADSNKFEAIQDYILANIPEDVKNGYRELSKDDASNLVSVGNYADMAQLYGRQAQVELDQLVSNLTDSPHATYVALRNLNDAYKQAQFANKMAFKYDVLANTNFRVPESPFHQNWVEVGIKRAIRFAVENGMDTITWTTGKQQVDRYTTALRANVDTIKYTKPESVNAETRAKLQSEYDAKLARYDELIAEMKTYFAGPEATDEEVSVIVKKRGELGREADKTKLESVKLALDISKLGEDDNTVTIVGIKDGKEVFSQTLNTQRPVMIHGENVTVRGLLGKEMADKISDPASRSGEFTGDSLSIGGEFYSNVYDRKITNFVNKYFGKYGVKAEKTTLPAYDSWVKNEKGIYDPVKQAHEVWSVDIPTEMADAVMNIGQPMFSTEVSAATSEAIKEHAEMVKIYQTNPADLTESQVRTLLQKGNVVIMSAKKTGMSNAEERAAHAAMKARLDGFKLNYLEVVGVFDEKERTFLIYNSNSDTRFFEHIGINEFGQQSVMFGRAGKFTIQAADNKLESTDLVMENRPEPETPTENGTFAVIQGKPFSFKVENLVKSPSAPRNYDDVIAKIEMHDALASLNEELRIISELGPELTNNIVRDANTGKPYDENTAVDLDFSKVGTWTSRTDILSSLSKEERKLLNSEFKIRDLWILELDDENLANSMKEVVAEDYKRRMSQLTSQENSARSVLSRSKSTVEQKEAAQTFLDSRAPKTKKALDALLSLRTALSNEYGFVPVFTNFEGRATFGGRIKSSTVDLPFGQRFFRAGEDRKVRATIEVDIALQALIKSHLKSQGLYIERPLEVSRPNKRQSTAEEMAAYDDYVQKMKVFQAQRSEIVKYHILKSLKYYNDNSDDAVVQRWNKMFYENFQDLLVGLSEKESEIYGSRGGRVLASLITALTSRRMQVTQNIELAFKVLDELFTSQKYFETGNLVGVPTEGFRIANPELRKINLLLRGYVKADSDQATAYLESRPANERKSLIVQAGDVLGLKNKKTNGYNNKFVYIPDLHAKIKAKGELEFLVEHLLAPSEFNAKNNNAMDLFGKKVGSFYSNLIGHVNPTTIDRWMNAYAYMVTGHLYDIKKENGVVTNVDFYGTPAGEDYDFMSGLIQVATDMFNKENGTDWTPSQVQSILWGQIMSTVGPLSKKGRTNGGEDFKASFLTLDRKLNPNKPFPESTKAILAKLDENAYSLIDDGEAAKALAYKNSADGTVFFSRDRMSEMEARNQAMNMSEERLKQGDAEAWEDVARRMVKNGALADTEIQAIKALSEKGDTEGLQKYVLGLNKMSPLELFVNSGRVALLLGVRNIARNLGGNSLRQFMDELARVPASVLDIGMVAFNKAIGGTNFERSTTSLLTNPVETLNAYKNALGAAATKGGKEFIEVLKGEDPGIIFEHPSLFRERTTGWKFLKPLEVFEKYGWRFQGAMDRPFNKAAFYRSLTELQYMRQKMEKANGNEITFAEAEDYLTAMDYQLAEQYALHATFQQDNPIANKYYQLVDGLPPTFRAVITSVTKFVKTPLNVVDYVMDYSGFWPMIKMAVREYNTKDWVDWKSSLKKVMDNPQDRKVMSMAISQGMIGSLMLHIGYRLAEAGLMAGFFDREDKSEEEQQQAKGTSFGKLQVGNYSVDVSWLAPNGFYLMAGASMFTTYQKYQDKLARLEDELAAAKEEQDEVKVNRITMEIQNHKKSSPGEETFTRIMKNIALQTPFLRQIDDIKTSYDQNRLVSGLAEKWISPESYVPAIVKEVAGNMDPYERVVSNEETLKRMSDKIQRNIPTLPGVSTVGRKLQETGVPFVSGLGRIMTGREAMPIRYDMFGKPVQNQTSTNPFKATTVSTDQLVKELDKYNITITKPEGLSAEQENQMRFEKGRYFEPLLRSVVETNDYPNLSDKDKKRVLDSAVRFITNNMKSKPSEKLTDEDVMFNLSMLPTRESFKSMVKESPDKILKPMTITDKRVLLAFNGANLSPNIGIQQIIEDIQKTSDITRFINDKFQYELMVGDKTKRKEAETNLAEFKADPTAALIRWWAQDKRFKASSERVNTRREQLAKEGKSAAEIETIIRKEASKRGAETRRRLKNFTKIEVTK